MHACRNQCKWDLPVVNSLKMNLCEEVLGRTDMIHILFLLPLFSHLLPAALSQSGIVECWPYLLGLGSCGPFVQGRVPLPPLQCCINIEQIYGSRQSMCLCPLLHINSTLALQVPSLCNIHIKPSLCSVPTEPPAMPPSLPPAQASAGTKNHSTIAVPPVHREPSRTPPPGLIVFGFHHSSGVNSNVRDSLVAIGFFLDLIVLGLSIVITTCY